MASESNTGVFIIYHRDKTGKKFRLFSYEEEEATRILAAVKICRELLQHEKVREPLKKFVKDFGEKHPDSWYAKYKWKTDAVVTKFIKVMLDENFPLLFCDDGFLNPNISGCHFRRKWDRLFTKYQGICLNGSRVRDMCAAAKKAKESNDPNSTVHKQYRTFIFLFAVTIFHELGHVFITFLSLGDADTPEGKESEYILNMSDIQGEEKPESGYTLERLVFGGIVAHFCDKELDDSQPGVPHLVTEKGKEPGEISQEIVDDFIRCKFKFPFEKAGPTIPPKAIGDCWDLTLPDDPLDPIRHPETRALADSYHANPFSYDEIKNLDLDKIFAAHPKIQIGPQSALARLVSEPGLSVKAM